MSLDMTGFIDSKFQSGGLATRTSYAPGQYVNGIWQEGVASTENHRVNIQPATEKQIADLEQGGERILDVRRLYVNGGDLFSISPSDTWTFPSDSGLDGVYRTRSLDNRPWRGYCRIMVAIVDD